MSKRFTSQIRAINVPPRKPTTQTVPDGIWSLSTLSSVPYARITGPGGFQKEFSWNEPIVVPEGTMGMLENSSFHPGDIVLNGGWDYGAAPRRVTVPVNLGFTSIGAPGQPPAGQFVPLPMPLAGATFPLGVIPQWPVDTRRALRAYLAIEWESADVGDDPVILAFDIPFTIRGFAAERSHNTVNSNVPTGTGYITDWTGVAGTRFGLIPLGYSAANGDGGEPHALLDYASFEAVIETPAFNLFRYTAYYVLEY